VIQWVTSPLLFSEFCQPNPRTSDLVEVAVVVICLTAPEYQISNFLNSSEHRTIVLSELCTVQYRASEWQFWTLPPKFLCAHTLQFYAQGLLSSLSGLILLYSSDHGFMHILSIGMKRSLCVVVFSSFALSQVV